MNEPLQRATIEKVILEAIHVTNLARQHDDQVPETSDAVLFGAGSPLDSLGLVSLLLEVEEGLADHGYAISLSDERAVSQKRSPFRNVAVLADYIQGLVNSPTP